MLWCMEQDLKSLWERYIPPPFIQCNKCKIKYYVEDINKGRLDCLKCGSFMFLTDK